MARDGSLVRCEVRCGVPYIQDRILSEGEERKLRWVTGSRVKVADKGDEQGRHIVAEGFLLPAACVPLRDIAPPVEDVALGIHAHEEKMTLEEHPAAE